jgi:hypothetical protein
MRKEQDQSDLVRKVSCRQQSLCANKQTLRDKAFNRTTLHAVKQDFFASNQRNNLLRTAREKLGPN